MSYEIAFTKQALKDMIDVEKSHFKEKVVKLLKEIKMSPYSLKIARFEPLVGEYKGLYSLRISKKHRLVYQILEEEKVVLIVSAWTHYENI
jgi:Txe/YoeB family toxin of toxin-antitoxin system